MAETARQKHTDVVQQNKSMFCLESFITSSRQSCVQLCEDGNTL